MKDFYLVDDDCLNLFDDIVEEEEVCIISPLSIIKKLVFWILGEDEEADPAVVMIDTDLDEPDEDDSPYLLCYVPHKEFDIGSFGFSVQGFDGPVYIYDKISSSYLVDLDEDKAIPFHYKSEDDEEKRDIKDAATSITSQENNNGEIHITTDEDGISGFTENFSDKNGNYTSYSFYSTDKDLVEAMAEHRSEVHRIMDDSIKK